MIFILSVVLCGIICFWYLSKYRIYLKMFEGISCPPAHPIIGHAFKLGATPKEFLSYILTYAKKFKNEVYLLWLGPNPYIVITDAEDIETVLSSPTILKKADFYNFLDPWLHKGLLTSTGSKWHKRRKMITPSFHFKILVDFLDVMNACGDKFIEKLKIKSTSGDIFDFQSMVHYCTMDVICETAMGVKINAMDNSNSDIPKAFQDMCRTMQNRMISLFKRSDAIFRFSEDYNVQEHAVKVLNDFTNNVIENRRKLFDSEAADNCITHDGMDRKLRKQAFLDNLLAATIDGLPLSNSDINEEVSTFIFEGHDTTSSGVTFATYILSRHSEIQQKAFEEQIMIFGKDKQRHPTFQEIQDMKYLELIIKESQRLYPSVPLIGRYTEENVIINGHLIPPNTGIVINIVGMGYNEKYFKEPYRVDPDRFRLDKRMNINPYYYVPFSAGPRNCIGQKFAMLEMKAILSKMIRNFEILPPTSGLHANGYFTDMSESDRQYYPNLSAVLTLKSDNGIQIKLRERNIE